jgi:biotin synthase
MSTTFDAMTDPALRHDWTREEIRTIYAQPLLNLLGTAQQLHLKNYKPQEVQLSQLISIKTGGCPEDCSYCPQSARYDTDVQSSELVDVDEVFVAARKARKEGVTRFCMGAAWREVQEGPEFEKVLEMVRGVSEMGLEVCCTLGMINESQAHRLADAGLHAYNHNLDTSPEYYEKIITTRSYEERLETLNSVRKAGITVCCGGIIGMGESDEDRVGLLHQLATLQPHPESVPINVLVQVEGTPLAPSEPLDPLVLVRAIATARIIMPMSRVRLSAGRQSLSRESVTLCFLAGANSIFVGDKLLTTPNPEHSEDSQLFEDLDLIPLGSD